ncbi:hypothetical protein BBO99_00006281 [Phytophthora kernoviae]|uniref:Kinesin-like protein n=1 Tax=Phytophthora kernoviae TaxID=325452 RepID=A0A3R7HGU6_9STRA|nr:hypothetical protein BBI17_006406 [Phytophthora kernoviae]RLN78009.1 hypothetical protein BBO99_00006281 [Phytophthora kernoviae]
MQIYNNDVFDLLQENKQRMKDPLAVREMIKGNGKQIYVSGLSEFRVTSVQETLQLLKAGNRNRTIRSTSFNEKSSRSHALLQLSVEVESRGMESATTIIRRAKLDLVDLAGSEKWDTDVVMGSDRSKELTSINQSLSALGNVISALVNPRRTHIPYRDSKLTRLLQDSLGGNTRTVVIATISPSESALDETISTLQFADRAKCVTVRVKVNELVDDAILLAQAQREISRLKLLLKQSSSHQQLSALEEQVGKLTKEKASLIAENQKLRRTIANLRKTTPGSFITENTAATKLKDAKLLLVPNPAPPAQQNNLRRSDDRPHSASSSSLQLSQLRLDLKALGEPRSRPEVFTAFVDENTENERFEQATKAQETILQEIQTERRDLERQLEFLSGNQAHDNENRNNEAQSGGNGEDELCPICGQAIDDHSDAELDRCIELEMNMVKQHNVAAVKAAPLSERSLPDTRTPQQRAESQVEKENPPRSNGPNTGAIPRNTASDLRIRRISTSAHGNVSPYTSIGVRKPSTPQQSRTASKLGAREGESSAPVGNRPSEAFSSDNRTHNDLQRSNSSRSSGVANNQADTHSPSSNPPEASIPILRQGHKGLKALKKFRSESPYNNAMLRKQKRTSSPQVSSSAPVVKDTSTGEGSDHPSIVFANSVRDIGLELSVYKFRCACQQIFSTISLEVF